MPPPRPDWVTMPNWHNAEDELKKDDAGVLNQVPNHQQNSVDGVNYHSTSTETWYPAAGNQLANEVDEPNQQGLTKPDNGSDKTTTNLLSITFIALLAALC